ncbi:MAG: glycosyltransferase family 2 protein [Spirochaetota bacterium]
MPQPKISIIIPVYDVEEYLSECLNSITGQTLEDIEIIIVNDASPDNSQKIIDEFAARDERIVSLTHPENKRQGAARNTGLKVATGEYIWFVDSDDSIELHACEMLYNTAKRENVDVLFFSFLLYRSGPNGREIYPDKGSIPAKELLYEKFSLSGGHPGTSRKYWRQLLSNGSLDTPTTYIYQAESLTRIQFREGVFHEDTDFAPKLFFAARSIYGIHYTPYFYRRLREGSTTNAFAHERKDDLLQAAVEILRFCAEKGFDQKHPLSQRGIDFLEIPLFEYPNAGGKQLRRQLHSTYKQLKQYSGQDDGVDDELWLRFARLRGTQKAKMILKVCSKKLGLYPYLKPIGKGLHDWYQKRKRSKGSQNGS